jgi:flagellar motor switch protein FliG
MGLTGKQKAAMLLMSLDAATAAELLKGIDPQMVQELAVELAYLDTAGYHSGKQSLELARQFYNSLQAKEGGFHLNSFLKEMLRSTVGSDKAEQIQTKIRDLLHQRDPFIPIRSVDSRTLASALESEHPQAAAVVLSELPAKKGSEVLGFLGEGIRISAIRRMTSCDAVATEAKARIAEMVWKRIEATKRSDTGTAIQVRPEQSLRKVAVMLRSLGKELRDGLLGALRGKDDKAGEMVANLMIVWEDIPQIADRSLQEALRGIEARKLALALHKADEAITGKIRSNISERAGATVDEETSLMSAPKKKDIEDAREEIVRILREMNEKGDLSFVEE